MAGHSRWAQIKRKKSAIDAKRGKVWAKISREITVAARAGGGDINANPRMRLAIAKAKAQNMPNDNISRAIAKGTGAGSEEHFDEIVYEGYGPGGTAIMVKTLTNNKNRTVADLRHLFTKCGGNLGDSGCVKFMFERKGIIRVPAEGVSEDDLLSAALDAGADDMKSDPEVHEITTDPDSLEQVRSAIDAKGIKVESADVAMVPVSGVKVADADTAKQLLRLMDMIEDMDDVQDVFSNFDIAEEIIESAAE